MLAAASPALAADVTPDRLINGDREPQNWLMNRRTYDGQRFSPLARINRDNVKNLKLAYAVPLGGTAGNEWIEATPLAEDGFLYITDSWGVLYKIDRTSGDVGRIVWCMDPKQEKQGTNRGAALWGNLVISPASWPARLIATDKDSGKVVWETNMMSANHSCASPRPRLPSRTGSLSARRAATAACATGSRGWTPRPAGCCGASSRFRAGRTGQRDLEGCKQRLADRRRRRLGDRHLRSRHQPDHLGHRQSGADVRPVNDARGGVVVAAP
jgi:hypothetical protein